MKKIIKVIIILGFSLVTVSFVQMSSDVQEVPDYCMLVMDQEGVPSTSLVTQDGTIHIKPDEMQENVTYQFLLPSSLSESKQR
ncbi:MAG: hypothetical protein HN855_06755 [Anaerolineae bacterium]|nr:hypothetical protein [Chloroflexota bacterium]MBT7324838.1 hypothetical protein [Anaerolineae bacterium]